MFQLLSLSFVLDFVVNGIIANCWIAVFTRGGFSLREASAACGIMYLSVALFELPTGYIADRYLGRRGSTIFGVGCLAASMLALYCTQDFALSAAAMTLAGFGSTFISGAKQAWFRDIVADRYPHRLKKLFADIDITGRIATITGIWCATFMIEKLSAASVWGLGSGLALFALMIASGIPKGSGDDHDKMVKTSAFSPEFKSYLLMPGLLLMIVAGAFFGIEDGVRSVVLPPLMMKLAGGNAMALAYQSTIQLLPRLLGAFVYRNVIVKSLRPAIFLTICMLAIAIIQASISTLSTYLAFAILWATAVFFFGIFFPLRETILHEVIDKIGAEKWRATILSVDSMITSILQASACYGLALSITEENLSSLLLVSAAALALCATCYFFAWMTNESTIGISTDKNAESPV